MQHFCRVLKVSPLSTFMFFSKSYAHVKKNLNVVFFPLLLFNRVTFLSPFSLYRNQFMKLCTGSNTKKWSWWVTHACTTKSIQWAATFTMSEERRFLLSRRFTDDVVWEQQSGCDILVKGDITDPRQNVNFLFLVNLLLKFCGWRWHDEQEEYHSPFTNLSTSLHICI